jgi:hypothetical protein
MDGFWSGNSEPCSWDGVWKEPEQDFFEWLNSGDYDFLEKEEENGSSSF